MKKKIIVGNWKSNKSSNEATNWLNQFLSFHVSIDQNNTIVLCPPLTLLCLVSRFTSQNMLSLYIGAQDISPFDSGSFTGAVNANQIKEFANYVIIGHSERRRFFHETDDILQKKVDLAVKAALIPIFCISEKDAFVPQGVKIVGYEPVFAIGSGITDSPENANEIARFLKEKYLFIESVLYGGSVTKSNIAQFTNKAYIDGVIPGRASLEARSFADIIISV